MIQSEYNTWFKIIFQRIACVLIYLVDLRSTYIENEIMKYEFESL